MSAVTSLITQVQQNDEEMQAMARELAKKPREHEQQLAPVHSAPAAYETKQKKGFWASLCCCCSSTQQTSVATPTVAPSTPPLVTQPNPPSTNPPVSNLAAPTQKFLLTPLPPEDVHKKTLVLDLDRHLYIRRSSQSRTLTS